MTGEISRRSPAKAQGALGGIKVLDLSEDLPGAYCTKLLAGLGATVVKVERPDGGDRMRWVGPFFEDKTGPDRGLPFLYFNTDKQSVTLSLVTRTGRAIFKKMAAWADIVVETLPPGTMHSLGLGYGDLEKTNPGLIMASITPFGQTGPYKDYALTDLTAQALGGLMIMVGEPDREPLALGGEQALCAAAVAAFTAVMTALLARPIHGFGQHLDVSICEMVAYTEWHATAAYAFNGATRRRRGRLNQQKILPTRDGYIGAWVTWPLVKQFIGGALEDAKFATTAGREEHTAAFGEAIQAWLADKARIDAYHQGQAAGLPWGHVATMADLVESPQYAARSFLRPLDHAPGGPAPYPRLPFRVGDLPDGPWQPAPRLGEHNRSFYGAVLGFDSQELVRLREIGAI